jgi:predicted ArsR family transcriptional regulator
VDRRAVASVAILDDDVRRALYAYARSSDRPITREGAAAAVGISRKLAAFHLDRLVEANLLTARIQASEPRRVGRAPKVYEPVREAVTVTVPERKPDLLASILIDATDAAGPSGVRQVEQTARVRGRDVGAAELARARPGRRGLQRYRTLMVAILERLGFEPAPVGDDIVLRNCPFHPLAAQSPELVCGMNREFVQGITEGLSADAHLCAVLAPHEGRCCVELRPRG